MRRVVLTGLSGSGKSTVAARLQYRCGVSVVDTDRAVEERTGRTVAEIFATDGEPTFRELEHAAFRDAIAGNSAVIATGGGTLLADRNRALVSPEEVLCLTGAVETLARRLEGGIGRPLLAQGARDVRSRLSTLLAERRTIYDLYPAIDTSERDPDSVAGEIAARAGLELVGELSFPGRGGSSVRLSRGLLERLPDVPEIGDSSRYLVVCDDTVEALGVPDRIAASLRERGAQVAVAAIPSGEQHKTLDTVAELYRAAAAAGLDRSGVVLGVGGGVVGDVAGMVAATYLRGVRLVLVPTTLLAQVDASIGGKVGVDLDGAKNLVGAFHPASLVAIDPDLLGTLPAPVLAAGCAEIIKIACMQSSALVQRLQSLQSAPGILDAADIIRISAQLKIGVVRRDPFERGDRMFLNFGHTVGHGLEAASHFSLSHGAAVAIGMVAECRLGERLGSTVPGTWQLLETMLPAFDLPVRAPGLDPECALSFAQHDKKRSGATMRVAVPANLGSGTVIEIGQADLRDALRYAIEGEQ